ERREDLPPRQRLLHYLHRLRNSGQARLEGSRPVQRKARSAVGTRLYLHADRHGGQDHTDWKEAALYSVKPVLLLEPGYIYMLIGMVGTTIAPWMQFYLQAAVVEKGVTAKE